MTITEWFTRLIGEDSVNAAAGRAQINQSTLSRQLNAGRLSPEMVVPLARAYGADVIDALVIHGLISPKDVRLHDVRVELARIPDKELADEVWRRMERGEGDNVWDEPVSPLRPVPDIPEGRKAAKDAYDPEAEYDQ